MALDVSQYKIIQAGKYYHFVSHFAAIMTPGFGSRKALLKYKDSILDTDKAKDKLQARYWSHFGGKD